MTNLVEQKIVSNFCKKKHNTTLILFTTTLLLLWFLPLLCLIVLAKGLGHCSNNIL